MCKNATVSISYNVISNNSANINGGGIYSENGNPAISNNIISNNNAINGGGGIACVGSNPSIINNTVTNNFALKGGALFCNSLSNPVLQNTIFWGNAATTGNQIYLNDDSSDPNFSYCDVQGGSMAFGLNSNVFYLGTYQNNINSDPLFVLPSSGSGTGFNGVIANWSLQNSSPCINAGDTTGNYPFLDIAGNPRMVGYIDIGAYENQIITGIINDLSRNHFNMYPNPVTNFITFEIDVNYLQVQVYNVNGQMLIDMKLKAGSNTLDVSALPSGVYIIKLNTEDGIAVKKFLKE
jgi:hypothetical protein